MTSHPITPFTLDAADGVAIAAYRSFPSSPAKAIVQIATAWPNTSAATPT